MSVPGSPEAIEPIRRLYRNLGLPGLLIGLFSILCLGFGLLVLRGEYERLWRVGRDDLRPLIAGWVRAVPVNYLGWTLADYADRWRRASGDESQARREELRWAFEELGRQLDRPGPLVEVVALELVEQGSPPLARWTPRRGPSQGPTDQVGRVQVVPAREDAPALELTVRYRAAPEVERTMDRLATSYRRLVWTVLALSIFPLLCLVYMALQARSLRERAAREAAQAATLDLADRTCHELGNVAFVLSNERRNLEDHLDQVERFVAEHPAALEAAARRAGLDESQRTRLQGALAREHAERAIAPEVELSDGLAIARDVCRQVAVCSEYIALTVRELDGYLRQSSLPVQLAPLSIATCLDDALALLGPRLASAGISVRRPAVGADVTALADRRLLVHALVNLLKNGAEAAAASPAPELSIAVIEDGAWLWLEVSDNGPGIAAQVLPRLFEGGYTTKGLGRGRGLAIVRASIDAQGGRLGVRSKPGSGTTFRVGLPRPTKESPD